MHHPVNSRYIQVHEWQIKFCREHHCAALLLTFFAAWHDWKIRNDDYYRRANDIAEVHGDGRPHNENAYLFFSMEHLVNGCLGFYSKKAISEGLDLLVSLNVVTIHKNPNPRYHFDKTKYFKFYPEICNQWIRENYSSPANSPQPIDYYDKAKLANRSDKSAPASRQNGRPSDESCQAITDTTNNTTNKNKLYNAQDVFILDKKNLGTQNEGNGTNAEVIRSVLVQQGFPAKYFHYPETMLIIEKLYLAGATPDLFIKAYNIADKATEGNFGIKYLVKVVEGQLKKSTDSPTKNNPIYFTDNDQSDYSKGLNWIDDIGNGGRVE
ncbi:hypothetical protein AYO45_01915 [Gammaproteobacteria bacterium SCGC AG-212-F23]|nr:hypothetical protein AYO45_01915 [Gammaproteobacteria bacterium SCGC AG-212-F23]